MKRRQMFVLAALAVSAAWLVFGCSGGGGGEGTCTPTAELCDGVDNDCDNAIDEDLTQACQTDGGQAGTQACVSGNWGTCEAAGPPPTETCNNQDDDADGSIDEDLQQACSTSCGSGVETCASGAWIGCTAPAPQTEVCDGQDNDCDGGIDEDLTRDCDSACGTGQETCSMGNWVGCNAPPPATETCDNQDNDCDAATDEDLARDCSTICGGGAETCQAGQWVNCTAREPVADEIPANGIDDDCDGQTDEGGCGIPESTTICSDDVGICSRGVKTCLASGDWGPCVDDNGVPVIVPGAVEEACDGEDNDCDGATDESFPTMGNACGTDEGECRAGVLGCVGAQEVCQGEIVDINEVCDGLDNDCDGATDDGLRPDMFETNETCETAENLEGEMFHGDEARVIAGVLYPEGGLEVDVDFYQIRVMELTDWCVPGLDQDDDYQVYVRLSNLPEGVDYDLCVTYDWDDDDNCDGDTLSEGETCVTEMGEGGAKQYDFFIDTDCLLNDDVDVLVKVTLHGGSGYSCLPYTLTIWAETLEE